MDKIAIISDIHGNREALKTTLKDIQERGCNKIFCLGDIISKGNFSNECIEIVKNNCDIVLKGNCDDCFSKKQDLKKLSLIDQERVKYYEKILYPEYKKYLNNLPL